jgi:hypothetical protein
MRRIILVSTMTAFAIAAGMAVGQPNKGPSPGTGSGSGSGSAKAGSGSAKIPFVGSGSGSAKPGAGSGSAAGSAKVTEPEPPVSGDEPDVDVLRQEYLKLRDELFESRARAATVASQLYSTKISMRLTYASGRMYGVSRASIRLDGANVYDNTAGAIASDDGIRFEGYIAPGRHIATFRVEAGGKDDSRFTTAVESTVVIEAVAGKDLVVAAKAKDDGNIAYQWKKKEQGTYKLGLDIDVRSIKRVTNDKASK